MRHLRKILAAGAVAGTIAMTSSACTADTTRGRVEHDVPASFTHAYALSEQLQGHRAAPKPHVTSTECHSSVNVTEDSGPGSWNCDLGYTVDGRKQKVSLLVLIDSLGCYQALDGEHRDAMIRDQATGTMLPDPKAGFDGCYDVYDGRTDVSKK